MLNSNRFNVFAVLVLITLGFFADGLWIYAKAELAQYLIKDAWQQVLKGKAKVKPWPWADTWPVARLQSKQHGVDLYVLQGAQGSALAFGPGFLSGSSALGGNGSSIIAGHRDTHFQFMQRLNSGDLLQMTFADGRSVEFKVTAINVIDSNKDALMVENTQAEIILVTCYPFNAVRPGGPLRYVAKAIEA